MQYLDEAIKKLKEQGGVISLDDDEEEMEDEDGLEWVLLKLSERACHNLIERKLDIICD